MVVKFLSDSSRSEAETPEKDVASTIQENMVDRVRQLASTDMPKHTKANPNQPGGGGGGGGMPPNLTPEQKKYYTGDMQCKGIVEKGNL
eukprot:696624-Pyramimonas_sp.AAC.1